MKAVNLFSSKGGVGKTTLTLALSSYFASQNLKVIIIDLDIQQSAFNFALKNQRDNIKCSNSVNTDLKGFDIVLFDHPQARRGEKFPLVGKVLTLMQPGYLDADSVISSKLSMENVIVNRFSDNRKAHRDFLKSLSGVSKNIHVITERSAHQNVIESGHYLFDSDYTCYNIDKARKDIKLIAESILND